MTVRELIEGLTSPKNEKYLDSEVTTAILLLNTKNDGEIIESKICQCYFNTETNKVMLSNFKDEVRTNDIEVSIKHVDEICN